jgi:pimeloyl-ACP methyl ester carboxylesterase
LGSIAQPTLLVAGENEPMFPPAEQEELARALPRARLELYKNCGHYPHWEYPERFARDVIRFVRG